MRGCDFLPFPLHFLRLSDPFIGSELAHTFAVSELTDSPKRKDKSIHNSTAKKYDFRRTFGQACMADDWPGIALPCSPRFTARQQLY